MPLTRLSASQTYLEMKITNSFRRRLISHLNSSSLISSTWRRQWTTKLGEWKNNFYWEIRSLQIIEMNHLWPFSIGKVQKWVRARFYSSIETISVRHNIVRVHTHLHFHHRHRSLTCFFVPHSENLSSLEHINTACSVPIVILFSVDSDIPSLHRAGRTRWSCWVVEKKASSDMIGVTWINEETIMTISWWSKLMFSIDFYVFFICMLWQSTIIVCRWAHIISQFPPRQSFVSWFSIILSRECSSTNFSCPQVKNSRDNFMNISRSFEDDDKYSPTLSSTKLAVLNI